MVDEVRGAKLDMPGTEEWVQAADARIRYYRMGEGPPVILLHGLGEAAVVWYSNMEPLSDGHSVYALDLPGHGASDKPNWSYSLEQSVDFLGAFMDALGLERASLVGNSMGGLLALALALERPQRVDRLVLEDSAGLGREVAWFLRLMSVPGLGELMSRQRREGVKWVLRKIFYNRSFATERLVDLLHREQSRPGNKAAMLRILRRGISIAGMKRPMILTGRLHQLEAPTLVVWGRQDIIFPATHGERAAELLPNGRLEVFDHCGHWPHIEVNQAYNKLLLDFLG